MDLTCAAEIQKVTISVKEKDGLVMRIVKVTLAREFDDLIAAAIQGGKTTMSQLQRANIDQAVMSIGAIRVSAKLIGGETDDRVEIPSMLGVKATGKAPPPDADGESPTIAMEFECSYRDDIWAFLGRNVGGVAHVTFTAKQLELTRSVA